jgi:hypothetical protein
MERAVADLEDRHVTVEMLAGDVAAEDLVLEDVLSMLGSANVLMELINIAQYSPYPGLGVQSRSGAGPDP